ncbi:hypothetical protein HY972_01325 [Candidatus Kaiserbacteria bacterium]|nr:hypothetical protein [Candidatus Kaiserbacteria bacterium]
MSETKEEILARRAELEIEIAELLEKSKSASQDERRCSLYAFVDSFNHERVHGTLGMTPIEKSAQYAKRLGGDNAV